jgi:predicted TIM-barrel fold metal-dependent hydrolase
MHDDLPIVDCHHHMWPARPAHRPPVSEKHRLLFGERIDAVLKSPYLLDNLRADMRGHNVVGTVFVECHAFYDKEGPAHLRSVGETRTVAQLAASDPGVLLGIVAAINLSLPAPEFEEALNAHVEAGGQLLRGVRCQLAWDDDPRLAWTAGRADTVCDPQFVKSAKVLAARRLSLDVWLYHTQLRFLSRLATAVPELTVRPNAPMRTHSLAGASLSATRGSFEDSVRLV